jgi:hypothetical protein
MQRALQRYTVNRHICTVCGVGQCGVVFLRSALLQWLYGLTQQ